MKRLSLLGFMGLLSSLLAGCPIWDAGSPGSAGCVGSSCGAGGSVGGCTQPLDCGINETCAPNGQCQSGDCSILGCVSGYHCVVNTSTSIASCVPGKGGTGGSGAGGSGSGAGGAGTGAGGASNAIYCGHPADCAAGSTCSPDTTCHVGDCKTNHCIFGYTCDNSDGACKPLNPATCDADPDCASLGSGAACVTGLCTQPSDQCFDQSQCNLGGNANCVAGKCTPSCASDTDCRDGFGCNTTLGICAKVAKSCNITNDCGGPSTVCVGGACVPRSTGGACPTSGDSWTENGCVPNQSPTFTCNNSGTNDGQQDVCHTGSVCLHHDCWISCDGANANACASQTVLQVCKPVTSMSASYDVCGTALSLGTDCGLNSPGGTGTCSAAKICIDGSCR